MATTLRSLIRNGDMPKVTHELGEKKEIEYHRALSYGVDNKFRKVASLYSTDAETDIALGIHCMYALVGGAHGGARTTVYAIARIHEVAILDLTKITTRALQFLTIREIVDYIAATPPRCAILVNLSSVNDRMYKVVKRLAGTEMKTNHRRIVFCLTSDESTIPTGTRRDYFPGTMDDKISLLLYLVPYAFADPDRLRIIAEMMRDYTVFEPKVKKLLNIGGSIDDFFQSLRYHVIKRNGVHTDDDTLEEFPSFEVKWRKSLSVDLQKTLVPSPEVTSTEIHRVLPIGISRIEAIQCIQSALPPELTSPYVLTVDSNATDDKCGKIAITQHTQHIVMNINCNVDPGIMTDVCRELRIGYRSVVQELSLTKMEMDNRFSSIDQEMDKKFSSLHGEIRALKDLLKADVNRKRPRDSELQICTKKTCLNVVTERFQSGILKKQCTSCIRQANSNIKNKFITPLNNSL
jgi:hypothetical protein